GKTWVRGAAKNDLHAAAARERAKHAKYKQLVDREALHFVPFVMESFGAMGAEASAFLLELRDYGLEHGRLFDDPRARAAGTLGGAADWQCVGGSAWLHGLVAPSS